MQGTVPMRLQVLLPLPEVMDMEQQVVEQIICNSVSKNTPALRRQHLVQTHKISPLNFLAYPRGRGRPNVNRRQGAAISKKRKATETPFSNISDFLAQYSVSQLPPAKKA